MHTKNKELIITVAMFSCKMKNRGSAIKIAVKRETVFFIFTIQETSRALNSEKIAATPIDAKNLGVSRRASSSYEKKCFSQGTKEYILKSVIANMRGTR